MVIADIMTKPLLPDLHYRATARMMGKASQMSKHSEDELQDTLKSFSKLKVNDSEEDEEPGDPELKAIENVDLVVSQELSRASTPVFYLGSSA